MGDGVQRGLQTHGRSRDRAGLKELDDVEVHRDAAERLEHHLDVARRRHDRRVMDHVVRRPRKGPIRETRLEHRVVGGDPVTDERAVRVLCALVVELVVRQEVRLLLLVPRMPGQEVR